MKNSATDAFYFFYKSDLDRRRLIHQQTLAHEKTINVSNSINCTLAKFIKLGFVSLLCTDKIKAPFTESPALS